MKEHVTNICQTACFELNRNSSIPRFLTEDATKTLVTSDILTRLDYRNCLILCVCPTLSSNLSKRFNTLAQDSFSWHSVIAIFCIPPAKSTLASHYRAHQVQSWMHYMVLVLSTTPNGYMPTASSVRLISFSDSRVLRIKQCKRKARGFASFDITFRTSCIKCFCRHYAGIKLQYYDYRENQTEASHNTIMIEKMD